MNKQELVKKIKEIDDIMKYSINGGTSLFNKDYPELLNLINENTKEIQIYSSNKKLIAKLIYLKKFDGDINKITFNNKIMIYENKIKNFKEAYVNSAQTQWDGYALKLSTIDDSELYSKNDTISRLENTYLEYLGKLGNRKLIQYDPKLFLSLYKHTSHLDNLNSNCNRFTDRLYILIKNIDIICHIHNKQKTWKIIKGNFRVVCPKCEPRYPAIAWFKKVYGNEWETMANMRKNKLSKIKTNSLGWFQNKYGFIDGKKRYEVYVTIKMNKLCELKANRYSKISQILFWVIYNRLSFKDKTYFFELNSEFVLKIPEKYNYNRTVMMLDFKQNKKIIEYNGNYWHSKEIDDIRYSILKDMGFEILVVTSDEYSRNNKNNMIVDKCVEFLKC